MYLGGEWSSPTSWGKPGILGTVVGVTRPFLYIRWDVFIGYTNDEDFHYMHKKNIAHTKEDYVKEFIRQTSRSGTTV